MRKHLLSIALLGMALTMHAQSFAPPIMGWSSWNTYHVNISDSLIRRQADALVSTGLKTAGYGYINIDDGFFGYRDDSGLMHAHPDRFPKGLRTVSDYIHSLGLKAGIYSDAGTNTCGSRYDNDKNGFGSGLYGHEEQDAQLYFKDWNFDFIKIDYCGAEALGLEEQKCYTAIRRAIDKTGRRDVSLNICRWTFPGIWAEGIATSWRISSDIRPKWSSVKRIIELNMPLSAYCRGGHYNDMDMLEISRGLKPEEEEVHFGMWCMMASPLLVGCDLTSIKPASLKLLKNTELIALDQDPLGLQAYPVQHVGDTYVLVKDIEKRRGRMRAVALYNPSDTAAHFSVPLSSLELGGKVKLRDLVHHSMTVSWLGGSPENVMRWDGVYSEQGGNYEMTISYVPAEHHGLVVTVNGKATRVKDLQDKGDLANVTIPVTLKAGYNTIEMGNPYDRAVDIDRFELSAPSSH